MLHCIYIFNINNACARQKTSMNYLEAKTVILKDSPPVPFKLIAIEAMAMVSVAGILVLLFT